MLLAILVLQLVSVTASAAQAAQALRVPHGTAIVLDGLVDEAEWKDASQHPLEGGGTLLVKSDGGTLMVAIRAPKDGWCHLYLFDGQQVRVLHASAALGALSYRADSTGAWQPSSGFAWDLRDRSMSAQAIAARQAYLQRSGWVASVGGMGRPGEREYVIRLDAGRLGAAWQLAVVYATGKDTYSVFRATLDDDTLKWALVMGEAPANCVFRPQRWPTVVVPEPAGRKSEKLPGVEVVR